MKKYLVTLRTDNHTVRVITAVIETEESVQRLLQHSHIVDVLGEVDYKGKVDGFVEVSEEEANKLLGKVEEVVETPSEEEVEPKKASK